MEANGEQRRLVHAPRSRHPEGRGRSADRHIRKQGTRNFAVADFCPLLRGETPLRAGQCERGRGEISTCYSPQRDLIIYSYINIAESSRKKWQFFLFILNVGHETADPDSLRLNASKHVFLCVGVCNKNTCHCSIIYQVTIVLRRKVWSHREDLFAMSNCNFIGA